jgi:hypothetical protein
MLRCSPSFKVIDKPQEVPRRSIRWVVTCEQMHHADAGQLRGHYLDQVIRTRHDLRPTIDGGLSKEFLGLGG